MGTVLFQIQVMPESPAVNLVSLSEFVKEVIEELGGSNLKIEEKPIAFGLKALVASFRISEDVDSSKLEEGLANLDEVSSVQIIDYRRAIN